MSVCQLVASPARRSKQANAHGDPISPSPLRCSCSPIYATPHDILDHNVHVRHARPRGLFKKAGPSAVRLLTAGLDQVTWYGGTFGGTGAALSPPVAPLDIGWNHRRCRISISLLPLELSAVRGKGAAQHKQISDNSSTPACSHLFSQSMTTFRAKSPVLSKFL